MKNQKNKKPGIAVNKEIIPEQQMPGRENLSIPSSPTLPSPGCTGINSLGPTSNIKKESKEKFTRTDDKLNLILNAALDAIICMDINGDIIFWNPQAEKIFGWNKAEVLGKKLSGLIIPEQYRQRHNEGLARYKKTGEGLVLNKLSEFSALKKNGEEFPIELTIVTIKEDKGEFFCAFIRDITERKLMEENIKSREARLISAQEVAKVGSWETNLQSFEVIWSQEIYRIFDTDPQTFHACHNAFLAFVHPEDKARVETAFANSINDSSLNMIDHRIITETGIIKVVQERWRIIRDVNGRPASAVGTCQDITENKIAEEKLKKIYEEKNTILESIGDAFFTVDRNWMVSYWNKEAEKMLQTPRNEIVGKQLWDVFKNSIDSTSYKKYHEALETNKVINFEDFYLSLDKWFEISVYPSSTGLSVYFKDITERKKAETEFKKISDEKNTILESIDDGFFAIDNNSLVTYWNRKAEILLGESRESVIGRNLHEMFTTPGSRIFYENYQKAIREKTTVHFEGWSIRTNKWFAVSAFASENGLSVYFKDITEKKNAEEIIIKSELRYRTLIEQATDTICIADASLKFIEVNPSGCKMFGYSREEFLQLHIADVLFAEDLITNPIQFDSLKAGKTTSNERRIKTKEGQLTAVEINAKMLENGHIMIFGRDISERKIAENKIKQSEARYRSLFEQNMAGVYQSTLRGVILNCNEAFAKMLKYDSPEEILKINASELYFSSADRGDFTSMVLSQKKINNYESVLKCKDGSPLYFIENITLRTDDITGEKFFDGIIIDITEKKQAELLLKESNERYNLVSNATNDMVWDYDLVTGSVYRNKEGWKKLFRTGNNKIENESIYDWDSRIHPDDFNKVNQVNEEIRKAERDFFEVECRMRRDDGTYVYIQDRGNVIRNEDGKAVRLIGATQDITARKEAEVEEQFNRNNLDALINNTKDLMWSVDKDFRLITSNKPFEEMSLVNFGKIVKQGSNVLEVASSPEMKNHFKRLYERAFTGEAFTETEYFSMPFESWSEISYYPIRNGNEIIGTACYSRDITERKRTELQLKESNELYNLISNATNDMVWDWDLETGKVYRNKEGWKKLFRTDDSKIEYGFIDDWDNRIHPDDLYKVEEVNEEIKKAEKDFYEVECRMRRDDGSYAYVHDRGNILRNKLGKAVRLIGATQDITARKEAELQVVKSEARFRSLVQNSSDLISILDKKGYYLYSSPAIKKILGHDPEFIVGKNAFSFTHPDDIATIKKRLTGYDSKSNDPGVITYRFKNSRNEWRWMESKLMDMTDDPEVQGYIFNSRDVTEKIIAKEKLITAGKFLQKTLTEQVLLRKKAEEGESKLKEAQALAHFGHWELNFESGLSTWSDEACRIYGIPSSEYTQTYETWMSFVHPEDMDYVFNLVNASKLLAEDTSINHRIILKDGTVKYIVSKSRYILDEGGTPVGLYGIVHDITESKIAEEEINKLSIIARETVNAVVITDPQEKIIWANEAFTRITEYELEDVIGKKPGDFLQGEETSPVTVRYMRNEIKNIRPFDCDIINYSRSGRKYWIHIQSQPQFDESGNIKYFFAIQTDITKEKEAEEILKASEERYRYLFNNNPAVIFIWDLHSFQILEANETAVKHYGYCREELLSLTILDLCLPQDYDTLKKFASKARQQEGFRSDHTRTHVNKAGHEMYMSVASHRIQYKGHDAMLIMGTNITEKVKLENELENERNQKQHAITDAVISAQEYERHVMGAELHDNINQILAGSLLFLGLAKDKLKIDHPYLQETGTLIGSAINEIRNLSHSLIPPSLNESELLVAIQDLVKQTQNTSDIIISLNTTDFDEAALTDKLKLNIYRVIQEQFNNILKHAGAQKIIVKLAGDNKETRLSIKDDGVGFNTNEKANGVGLMNIKTRASLFNGEVTIISSPGKGCELKVLFNGNPRNGIL